MTERSTPAPNDPAGADTPYPGRALSESGAPHLLDGGALEADGPQWGPSRPPKTDAADTSAQDQGDPTAPEPGAAGSDPGDPVAQPGRSAAGEADPLAPQSSSEPTTISPGRGESAGGAGTGGSNSG